MKAVLYAGFASIIGVKMRGRRCFSSHHLIIIRPTCAGSGRTFVCFNLRMDGRIEAVIDFSVFTQ